MSSKESFLFTRTIFAIMNGNWFYSQTFLFGGLRILYLIIYMFLILCRFQSLGTSSCSSFAFFCFWQTVYVVYMKRAWTRRKLYKSSGPLEPVLMSGFCSVKWMRVIRDFSQWERRPRRRRESTMVNLYNNCMLECIELNTSTSLSLETEREKTFLRVFGTTRTW